MLKIETLRNLISLTTDEAIRTELETELTKAEETAAKRAEETAAKKAEYDAAHDVVMGVLYEATEGLTLAELYEKCHGAMTLSKAKLSYALRVYWADEVEKTVGKVNKYTAKA